MNPSANTPPAATARDYSAKPYRTAWVAAWWFIDFAITATTVATGQLSGLSLHYLYLVIAYFSWACRQTWYSNIPNTPHLAPYTVALRCTSRCQR
ncbi:hypothetical protein [Corynebacterium argentoratense]|uniref:hypothetical protein n=1 Tax=Corynebacterium argentoratense TaxID=42817 RepID=UPI000AEC6F2B|nr:hypothetical protein [Corynebacterium argentoratense]